MPTLQVPYALNPLVANPANLLALQQQQLLTAQAAQQQLQKASLHKKVNCFPSSQNVLHILQLTEKPPVTTLFVGNIHEKCTNDLAKLLLQVNA